MLARFPYVKGEGKFWKGLKTLVAGLRRWLVLPIIDGLLEPEGRLAQWLERLVHTEEVGGSNPPSPTIWGQDSSRLPWLRVPVLPCRGGETADALRSGRSVLMDVWVQIPPSAPDYYGGGAVGRSNVALGRQFTRACSSVDRALPCGGRGRGFESRQARHLFTRFMSSGVGRALAPMGLLSRVSRAVSSDG